MGFPAWLHQWLESYLHHRSAFVKYGATNSAVFEISSGVPQGSHLGPILFSLFVNDVYKVIDSSLVMFADDLKIFRQILTQEDGAMLQADIQSLESWCDANGLTINIQKCKAISFSRSDHPYQHDYLIKGVSVDRVEFIKDLGVIVDRKLSFKEHLAMITSKARVVLGFIFRNTKDFDDVNAIKVLYCSLVRSLLEYGIQIWAPKLIGQMALVESVQRKFTRYLLSSRGSNTNEPPEYQQRLLTLNMQSMQSRISFLRRLFIFDLINNNINSPQLLEMVPIHAPQRTLREHVFLRIQNQGRRQYHNPFIECCKLFNDVWHLFEFGMTKDSFKNRIRNLN